MDTDPVCERVSSSTPTTMFLNGAAHPYREFRDAMTLGSVCQYQLVYLTRSLFSVVIESGLVQYAADNVLQRVTAFRSTEGNAAITFEAGCSTVYFFVRVQPRDDARINERDLLELHLEARI